jgi:hypothetical protein
MTKPKDYDYKVGYKKPPKETQFKSGKSGNPQGRPKKVAPSLADAFLAFSERYISVIENGERKRKTMIEAFVAQLFAAALKGDRQACKLIVSLQLKYGPKASPKPAFAFIQRRYVAPPPFFGFDENGNAIGGPGSGPNKIVGEN